VFGAVELSGCADADELLAQPKRLALLVFLLLARPRGFVRRDRIAGIFWPEHSDFHARAALRKAVHGVRQVLGADTIVSRGDDEVAASREQLWCDAVAFNQAVADGQCARALELYRGELMDGFFADAPGFERWIEAEREVYREAAGQAAWTLAERYEKGADLTSAARWARRAAKFALTDERRIRRVISLLERAGDRAGAAAIYEEFAAHLRSELQVEPSEETLALIRRVRGRQ
jgi:DNA-binding SARP family transcriptional activator